MYAAMVSGRAGSAASPWRRHQSVKILRSARMARFVFWLNAPRAASTKSSNDSG